MHNYLRANKFSRAAQRIAWYLVFGFAMSWIVAWVLSWQAHLIAPGRYSFSQFATASQQSPLAVTYFLYDSRWVGVWEQQYSVERTYRQATANGAPMQLWWAWEPVAPSGSTMQTFVELQNTFSSLESPPSVRDPLLHEKMNDSGVGVLIEEPVPGWVLMKYAQIKYGWPALSHQVHRAYNSKEFNTDRSFISDTHGAIGLPIMMMDQMSKTTVFPYRPIWVGLWVNTLFYAVIFWMLLSIERAYRHARRLRRGLCPYCAYDLEFILRDGCAECGWRKA